MWGRYRPLNGLWGPEELIVEGVSDTNFPSGGWLIARGGDFYCTYSLSGQSWYRVRPANGVWSGPVLFDSRGGGLRFAWSPVNSEWAATYAYDYDGNSGGRWFEVFARFSNDNGATWTTEYNVSDGTALDRNGEITYDAAGNFHVVWQGFGCDGCQPDILYRPRIQGTWRPKTNVTNTPARTGAPQDAIVAQGNMLWLGYADNQIDGYEDAYLTNNPQGNLGVTGKVSGFVRDQYGVGVRSAFVTASGNYATVTNHDGSYSLVLPPATYGSITASRDYYTSQAIINIAVTAGGSQTRHFTITGQAPAPVATFTVTPQVRQNVLYWEYPSSANLTGGVVRFKTGGFPTSPTDGTLFLDDVAAPGVARVRTHANLAAGIKYYYAAFAYFADASRYYAGAASAAGTPLAAADFDSDGDVDLSDFARLQNCFAGPNRPPLCP